MKKNRKGFTLIELLVVIAIIGLLSTLAIVSLNTARQKSRDAKRQTDIRLIQTGVELYTNETGAAPTSTTWALLNTALASYVVGGNLPLPTNTPACVINAGGTDFDGDCYMYCQRGGKYLLRARTEAGTTISGDLDAATSGTYTTAGDCFTNVGATTAVPAISCVDPIFCLGTQ
jgi:prepilin-type N-terminal cleavage/methylation domain-containing protein